jgi:hypothetical protein
MSARTHVIVALAALSSLACGGLGGPGASVPSALQGSWYRDGKQLTIGEHALGDWEARDLDLPGTYVNDMFVFQNVDFKGRGSRTTCSGSLELKSGELDVELTGACEELNGRWSRDTAGPKKKAKAAASTAAAATPAPAASASSTVDQCERYVDCVCDISISIRHRVGDTSYEASCDVARAMVDLGTTQADCREALRQMGPWFDGIEYAYGYQGVTVPSRCREY